MILVALALVAVAAALPVEEPVKIVRSETEQGPEGNYAFSFEAENGIKQQETGELKEVLNEENKPQSVVVVRGTYSYPGEDGTPVVVSYVADENGFQATGDSIPKNPQ